MPHAADHSESCASTVEAPLVIGGATAALARLYGRIYRRMLMVAVPVSWGIAMLVSMSFLRANTLEGMVTGLTASIVVAGMALGMVLVFANAHLVISALAGSRLPVPPYSRGEFIASVANSLLLTLWTMMMFAQHQLGANFLFWGLFDIDEPGPLFNPDIDPAWWKGFLFLIATTIALIVGRYRWPTLTLPWLLLTVVSALAWLLLIVRYTRSNDLIDYRISIAALEGTVTWWMPQGEGGTFLTVIAGLVGFFRIRAAWLAFQQGS